MSSIRDIVDVQISLETPSISQTGFGTLNILGESEKLPKTDIWVLTFDAEMVTENQFTCKVNGDTIGPVTYATSHDATMDAIATAIQDHADVATAVATAEEHAWKDTITITSVDDTKIVITEIAITGGASQPGVEDAQTQALTRIRFYSSMTAVAVDFATTDLEYKAASAAFSQDPAPDQIAISRKNAAGETWVEALNKVVLESDEWYGLVICERTQSDVEAVAAWVETHTKLFLTASNDPVILGSGTTDVASTFKSNSYARSGVIYHNNADGSATDPWPDAAWFGKMLPMQPGSATWMFKTLSGVTVVTLTDTEANYALGKYCNIYEAIHGVNMTREGRVGSGEYLDVMRGIDWLEMRIAERVFALLETQPKVPYTDPGVQSVVGEVKAQLSAAVSANVLAADPAPVVSAPLVADVSPVDRANRYLPDITFTGTLAGAVHSVAIRGTISV